MAFHPPLSPTHPTREQVAVQLFYGNGRGPDRVSARRGWGGAQCACVGCVGGLVLVEVDVTPTPSNAPDPEQMAGQGLSAEPELIACAMSYCLRPPPPNASPTTHPDFCTQNHPTPSPLPSIMSYFYFSLAPSFCRRHSFTRSPFHSFTCGLIHQAL